MKRTKVKIQIQAPGASTDGSIVAVSDSLLRKWKIPPHQPLQLRFGSFRQDVRVIPSGTPGVLRLNGALAARMGLTTGHRLCLQYKSAAKALTLGPLIGVMVSRVYAGTPDKPFGANTAFCRELTEACRLYGAAVFFSTPDDLVAQGDTVRGWHYAGGWKKAAFPLPHVLYNRLTSRKLENRSSVQQFIAHARAKQNTLLFNEKYLNKSEVFDALRHEAGLQVYLPESHLLKSLQQLKSMCAKYPTVFLKPVTGSLGKGIIRIRRQEGGGYACHFASLNGSRKLSYPSVTALYSALAGKIKTQRYQIQQGLNLLTVGGRPVDFRAVVQRGETGQWSVTSIVARIAGNHHFVSNIARGGTLSTVKDALARSGSASAAGGLAKLRRASLQIAKGIEAQVQGHFAELGVDLALDANGRVWLIEVNSKPSKEDNTPLSAENKIRPSVRQLVQYSRFAAKF
ncbi:YheC/D like ATP-grasp [Paenibacillus sp. UNCCL117]|uniref:YheC/YheD family endospore coat-associated protein n=1 Tax=unclassified Paenibacillus TaxID=185978 RepID=UPI00089103BA|nr:MULTISPECIES: YheC/YheD family protein [unclassified Paenibacillus]SDC08264.1 YheC/D like ATP-grasp [Paenibacillus sp. cl123]SFW38217.1 YheC/D like ATP-grasp [Paenibacillus sp. UNCCL117]